MNPLPHQLGLWSQAVTAFAPATRFTSVELKFTRASTQGSDAQFVQFKGVNIYSGCKLQSLQQFGIWIHPVWGRA